jgi:type I restriction enzyme S subunit
MKKGWEIKTLDQISVNLDSRRIPITKAVRTSGEYPYYGASGIVDYVADYIFNEDTLLISEDGANLLARSTPIAFPASGKYWVNNHAHILKFENMTTQRFVELFLESIPLDDYITGAAQPKLNQKALNSIPIPVPLLPEQRRIVGILDEAFEGIAKAKANAEKNLQNACELFESHLQSVFTKRGEGWVEKHKSLADMCELIVDCEHKTAPTQEEGIPSIRTPNIGKGRLLLDGVYRVSKKTYTEWTRRAVPSAGDLILAREAPAGNVAVIPENLPLCLGQRTVLIRPNREIFNSEFLVMLLLQPKMQRKLLDHSRGATVQHVNMKDIRALDVGAVPPLTTQRLIVEKVNNVSTENGRLISIYQQKLALLEALKKSLLHQAFSGQL